MPPLRLAPTATQGTKQTFAQERTLDAEGRKVRVLEQENHGERNISALE